VNTVSYLSPSSERPEGLIVSGGKDAIIEVKGLRKTPDAHAERLLVGHQHNVCALDVSPDGKWIVSGSWDASARVWSSDKWECVAELVEHEASVWAVLAFDKDTIITGKSLFFLKKKTIQ
jgi:phospholipase A-2-activating protein